MKKIDGGEARCPSTTKAGQPCKAPASMLDPSTGLCPAHVPGGNEKLRRAGRKGGVALKERWSGVRGLKPGELPDLDSPQAAEKWLEIVGRAVSSGRMGHNESNAVTRAVREFLRAHEAGAVSDQVKRLEKALNELRGGKPMKVVR